MKWIGKRWKQWSVSKRIIGLMLSGTVGILVLTMGLFIWDRSRQKPRVLAALKLLAEEASGQEYSFAPLLQIIREGRTEQEGYVNLSFLDAEALGFTWIGLKQRDLTFSSIRYQLMFDKEERVAAGKAAYQMAGVGVLDMDSYLTEDSFIVRIPQMHCDYLRMNPYHIKSQYENSLLYDVLGEKLGMVQEDFSISVDSLFSWGFDWDREDRGDGEDLIQAFLIKYKERLDAIWRQITVRKESEAKPVLVNGVYENCDVFHFSLPTELVEWYLDYSLPDAKKEWLKPICWKEDSIDLVIFMDDRKRIYRIETVMQPEVEGIVYPTEIVCSLRGEERLLDKVQVMLKIELQTGQLELQMDWENQWNPDERKIFFLVNEIRPERMERIRSNLVIDIASGESDIEYEMHLPLLVSDGEHSIKRLEQPILAPDGEIVDVFELDLIAFLKFSRDFNFALFR